MSFNKLPPQNTCSSSTQGAKGRIKYLDTLRGFTMLLVVYQHVRNFSLGDLPVEDSPLALFFIAFRMPMFFFISGYIAYKHFTYWSFCNYKQRLMTKLRVQLVPTIIFWSVLSYLGLHNWTFPGGFWFTEVLFEMFLIYFTFAFLCKRFKGWIEDMMLVTFALALFSIKGLFVNFPDIEFLRLRELGTYLVFFVFGLMSRKYNRSFMSLTENPYSLTFCIIIPLVLLGVLYGPVKLPLGHGITGPVQIINGVCLVVVIFTMFRKSKDYWNKNGVLQRIFEYIGRRTLDIYMLHYFFLPVLPSLSLYLKNSHSADIVEFFIVSTITLMVTVVVLLVSAFLRTSPILAKYLFGVSPKKVIPDTTSTC